jgi:uncharacterized protein YndB with AHSA1/START domain
MNQVKPYQLWIGHAGDARAFQEAADRGIRAIVQLGLADPPLQPPRELVYCRIPLLDGCGNDPAVLRLAIDSVAALLREATPTLVCCGAGMSRSPVIVAAAISQVEHANLEECLKRVAEHHPADVSPGLWEDVRRGQETRQPTAGSAAATPGSVFVTYIATSPERLWESLTSGDLTRQYFFGRRLESDWKVGSPFRLVMADGRIDSQGKVLESEPPRRLAVTWHVEWLEELRHLPPAIVAFQIDALGKVARLTVSEFHPEGIDRKYVEGGRRGWPIILSGLKTLLETGRPLPRFALADMPTE